MDPNENYAEQIRLARLLITAADTGELSLYTRHEARALLDQAVELAELVIALNDWICNGGFPPDKFKR